MDDAEIVLSKELLDPDPQTHIVDSFNQKLFLQDGKVDEKTNLFYELNKFQETYYLEGDKLADFDYQWENSNLEKKFLYPEQMLWYNVIVTALIDWKDLFPHRNEYIYEFKRLKRWFFTDRSESEGSFDYCCAQTHCDKYAILRAIIKWSRNNI